MSILCSRNACACAWLSALVQSLLGPPPERGNPKKDDDNKGVELDSWGVVSPGRASPSGSAGSRGSDSFEDWCLYGAGGTVAQAASASHGASAPRL